MQQEDADSRAEAEQKQVEKRAAISVHVVHAAIYQEGLDELRRTSSALAWSALAAGMSMGFSLLAEALLLANLPDEVWRPLISKGRYAVGFLIVILGRQQLFTENTLIVVLPLLRERSRDALAAVLRLWGVVLAANLLGTFVFALLIAKAFTFTPAVTSALAAATAGAVPASFGTGFVRAVFAGWLIALTIWLLPAAATSRVTIIFILTYLIGLGGFYHCIAGSVKVLYAVMTGTADWTGFLFHFLPPVLLGNIAGGVALVAALGHAQVASGEPRKPESTLLSIDKL